MLKISGLAVINVVLDALALVGRASMAFSQNVGRLSVFLGSALCCMVTPPYYWRQCAAQAIEIGYYSLAMVGVTALFAGMVLTLQIYVGFADFASASNVADVVTVSMVRELGPVLIGLMVAGRVGASMAAELGAMAITEQIDAVVTLSINPVRYLVVPRLLAGGLATPMLVLAGDVISVFGGYMVGVYALGFNADRYIQGVWESLEIADVVVGLVKAVAFGFIVTLMGCWYGYFSHSGSQGVGRASRDAVVSASILVLASDYLISLALLAR